jgi:hypothetical protein
VAVRGGRSDVRPEGHYRLTERALEGGREAPRRPVELALPPLGFRPADLVGPAVLQEGEDAQQQREHRDHQPQTAVASGPDHGASVAAAAAQPFGRPPGIYIPYSEIAPP